MAITASEAATIAVAHGLNLADAAALRNLAADVAEAAALAAQFKSAGSTLGERIAAAERRGDFKTTSELKAEQFIRLRQKTDHNGSRAPGAAAAVLNASADNGAAAPEAEALPPPQPAALTTGATGRPPQPSLEQRIADGEAAGDQAATAELKAQQFLEQAARMNGERYDRH